MKTKLQSYTLYTKCKEIKCFHKSNFNYYILINMFSNSVVHKISKNKDKY